MESRQREGEWEEDPSRNDGRLPLEQMVRLPLEPTVVLNQERKEFISQDLPQKCRAVTGFVATWY